MNKHIALLAALTLLLACQPNAPLADYEAKSSQEQALKRVLLEFQEGVVNRDSRKIESLIHEKAALMIGRDRKILSKAEYAKVLPARLAENASITLATPKMEVLGDQAQIKIYMTRGGGKFLMVFHMTRENDNWTISGWEY